MGDRDPISTVPPASPVCRVHLESEGALEIQLTGIHLDLESRTIALEQGDEVVCQYPKLAPARRPNLAPAVAGDPS